MKPLATLFAAGLLAVAASAGAEEKTYLETSVSGTQISGYVNTSAHWDFAPVPPVDASQIQAVPEPSTLALLGIGCAVLGLAARNRRR
ncbi:MAG: PEP-CTERM sorting domain-containing protein [Verrucomicrobia bacterium]|nr:PEP-CTERM sorting domain-containing protein [Verrucomicrobiota bacterium]